MSLYADAAKAVSNSENAGGSLKSRIYNGKSWQHPPSAIFALVSETIKWSPVLKDVIERSELLKHEKKLNPVLGSLLVHDFLLSKRGIQTSTSHPLHSAVLKHKARIHAEFTKIRVRRGFANVEAWRQSINASNDDGDSDSETPRSGRHPRWIRINTLKTTLDKQLSTTFRGYKEVDAVARITLAKRDDKTFVKDPHITDLIALPPGHDLSKLEAYALGEIIIQDKASCFPAFLLDPASIGGSVIDACAAPGNKTTHLAALIDPGHANLDRHVIAFEKDRNRTKVLEKMVNQAGAGKIVKIRGATDFLRSKGSDFAGVTAILLDPSCSGSGIVGRDDGPKLELPTNPSQTTSIKRKRDDENEGQSGRGTKDLKAETDKLDQRLDSLAAFQLKLLRHAMSFPTVSRIVYSTCSIHSEENEAVVMQGLQPENGWRLLQRNQQVEGLQRWPVRGDLNACSKIASKMQNIAGLSSPKEIAESCIRCDKNSDSGTIGFFVAGFIRDLSQGSGQAGGGESLAAQDEEWEGFGD